MGKWQDIEYLGRTDWDEGLATLNFAHPDPAFLAGQFIQVAMPSDAPRPIKRAYSIGSAPGAAMELYIVVVEGGALTPQLFALKPGDIVQMATKFAGHFTLEKVGPTKTLWLISTGTGLAPYISMIRQGALWDNYDKIAVFHGVRTAAQLAYRAELEAIEAARPGRFFYLPAVSREEVDGALSGRVTTTFQAAIERVGEAVNAETNRFMLCGNKAMLDEMTAMLGEYGLKRALRSKPGEIHSEVYF